jgi:hypothetical protein
MDPGIAGPGMCYLSPDEADRYQQQREELAERIRAVAAIEKVLLRPDRHLVSFDLPGDGGHPRAAVAVGDLDTAANLAAAAAPTTGRCGSGTRPPVEP